MKRIVCTRGGAPFPMVKKFDTFDSTIEIMQNELSMQSKFYVPYVNTDFFNGYKGGILDEGDYWYVCGIRSDTKSKVLFLADIKYRDNIKVYSDLKEVHRILPSLIPNPNHNGQMIITQVLVHSDGLDGGWSHGCQTVYPLYWKSFIDQFEINETGVYTLVRSPYWRPTDIYKIGLKNV